MEFRHLKTFEVIASQMSFHRAAEILHCTQSTVSAQVKALEGDLGTPLFERRGRGIALTPAGMELLQHTRRLLEQEREVYSVVRGRSEASGMIKLRCPQTVSAVYLPEIMARFQRRHPRVGFDVAICGYHHLAEEMRTGMVDLAFLYCCAPLGLDLECARVLDEPMVFLVPEHAEAARKRSMDVADLRGMAMAVCKYDCGYRMDLERELKEAHVPLGALYELNSLASQAECVRRGMGVALVPAVAAAPEVARGGLRAVPWARPSVLHFIRPRAAATAGPLADFAAIVDEFFAKERARRLRRPSGALHKEGGHGSRR